MAVHAEENFAQSAELGYSCALQFIYNGARIFGCNSPSELEMEDEEQVLVWPHEMPTSRTATGGARMEE